jgi:hypothetical protein
MCQGRDQDLEQDRDQDLEQDRDRDLEQDRDRNWELSVCLPRVGLNMSRSFGLDSVETCLPLV